MRTRLISTGCLLLCLAGCSTFHHKTTVHSPGNELSLSCEDIALSKSLAHYGRGLLYEASGTTNTRHTLRELNRALDYAPHNHNLHTKAAVTAMHCGDQDEAVRMLRKSVEKNPRDYQARIDLASLYQLLGQNNDAIHELLTALKINNKDPYIYISIANLYFAGHQTQKAIRILHRGLRHSSPTLDINQYLFIKGRELLTEHNTDAAIACFSQLAKLAPQKQPAIYQLLAEIFIASHKPDEAQRILRKAVRHRTPTPQNFISLALLYQQKYPQKSITTLKSALKKFPDNPIITFTLARTLSNADHHQEAIKYFEKTRSIAQNTDSSTKKIRLNSTFYQYYSFACQQAGNSGKAEQILKDGLIKHPGRPELLNALAYTWAQHNINLDKAIEYVNRALLIAPENPAYIDTLGWIYFRQKRFNLALREIHKAHLLIGDDSEVLYHLGKIYLALDKPEAALRYLKRAAELSPENQALALKIKSTIHQAQQQ